MKKSYLILGIIIATIWGTNKCLAQFATASRPIPSFNNYNNNQGSYANQFRPNNYNAYGNGQGSYANQFNATPYNRLGSFAGGQSRVPSYYNRGGTTPPPWPRNSSGNQNRPNNQNQQNVQLGTQGNPSANQNQPNNNNNYGRPPTQNLPNNNNVQGGATQPTHTVRRIQINNGYAHGKRMNLWNNTQTNSGTNSPAVASPAYQRINLRLYNPVRTNFSFQRGSSTNGNSPNNNAQPNPPANGNSPNNNAQPNPPVGILR